MAGLVYFGNDNYQTWIKAPSSGMSAGSTNYTNQQQLLNGRVSVKRSRGSARTFEPAWIGSLTSTQDSLQTVLDFSNGVYGDGPFYWLDPFAMGTNILPLHWSVPHVTEKDWPKLTNSGDVDYINTAYANGYPYRNAYFYNLTDNSRKLRIIVPDGYTFHFGWHSSVADSTGVKIGVTDAAGDGTIDSPPSILAGSTTRVNYSVNGGTDCKYVDIFIGSACTVVAMTGLILPTGQTPPTGAFVSGKGTTGLEFARIPSMEYYSSAIDGGRVGMSASLVEV